MRICLVQINLLSVSLWISDRSEPDSCSLFCFLSKTLRLFRPDPADLCTLVQVLPVHLQHLLLTPHTHTFEASETTFCCFVPAEQLQCHSEPLGSLKVFTINDRQSNSSSVSTAARQIWKQASSLHMTSSNPSTRSSLMSLISGAAPALT